MIKTKKGTTTFKGTTAEILDDYRCITKYIVRTLESEEGLKREEAVELVKKVQAHGLMTDEELNKCMEEEMKRIFGVIAKILGKEREEESNE